MKTLPTKLVAVKKKKPIEPTKLKSRMLLVEITKVKMKKTHMLDGQTQQQ